MVVVNDFGIANFKLAQKVMISGKCQCKPKEACPCLEWINEQKCRCGVFWMESSRPLTAGEKKVLLAIKERILTKCKLHGI